MYRYFQCFRYFSLYFSHVLDIASKLLSPGSFLHSHADATNAGQPPISCLELPCCDWSLLGAIRQALLSEGAAGR